MIKLMVQQESEQHSTNKSYYLSIDIKALHENNLMKKLGQRDFMLLLAIMSYMDEYGQSFPSQRTLAELTGMNKMTVNKGIQKLLEFKINGQHLLTRELVPAKRGGDASIYTVHTSILQDVADTYEHCQVEVKEAKKQKTPDDIIAYIENQNRGKDLVPYDYIRYFEALYEQTFNIKVISNKKGNVGFVKPIKDKFMSKLSEAEIIEMFKFIVQNYERYWRNGTYQYPTLGAVCSWLGNDALIKMQTEKRQIAEKEAEANIEYDNSFFLSL